MSPRHSLVLALLALVPHAFAQQLPSAGGQLQQIPPAPVPPRASPDVRIEQQPAPSAKTDGLELPTISVRELKVTGARAYSESELVAMTGFVPGSRLSLADLRALADKITQHYRANGHFLAQAYLPAQEVRDNVVTIAVSEGQYGKVTLRNATGFSDRLVLDDLQGLNPGDPILMEPLEHRLLLLSDLPGVNVRSTLVPGASVGTSDLIVDVTPGQRVSGSIDADNAGNPYTGEVRLGATVNFNNLLGLGDVASLRLLSSGSGLNYGRASYQMQVGRAQVGVAYSRLDYTLGKQFRVLGAHGTAEIASLYGRYPLIRSRNDNLFLQLAYDAKRFHDQLDAIPSVSDKRAGVLMTSIHGDHTDAAWGGSQTAYGLTWSAGTIDLQTPAVRALDAATAQTQGHYNKLAFNAMRLQRLGGPFSMYLGANGQIASKNLDVSEKMELGGMNAVRAYPEGEAYADEGYVLTLEARMDLPPLAVSMPGQMQLIGFVDSGHVRTNTDPWATGPNSRTLHGAGVGANWSYPGSFSVRAYYARKLGSGAANSSPDKSGRAWIQLVKYF